ncbi:MAG: helicase [Candidatus Taylorbacteria bacterium]|nr:helicase [Candidatus Taylorbacteria bacterium]
MTQLEALDILKIGHNVYLTGSAGSGKTYVLNQYINYLKSHGVGVGITASTGIAATHMGGTTIHSWAGIGIKDSLDEYEIDKMEQNKLLWNRFQRTNVLIIDEISMLDSIRLDMIDKVCKSFKRKSDPFGGMQVVLCGDFFQLPPISRNDMTVKMAYHSDAWKNSNIKICYLHEQHRQNDDDFTKVLNHIRAGKLAPELVSLLNTRLGVVLDTATKLYTHNADVDSMNDEELSKIDDDTKTFTMTSYGRPHLIEALKKSCLAPERLLLKKGARVMCVKNNFDAGYVNGTLGVIHDFDTSGNPIVKIFSGEKIVIEGATWQIEEDGKVKAEITQIPLRLAWAITVHKSQGMSLDSAEIDLSKSFALGQGYVALSRVRTLAGLKLVGFNDIALMIDKNVLAFDRELKINSMNARRHIATIDDVTKKKKHHAFILTSGGCIVEQEVVPVKREKKVKIPTQETTFALFHEGLTLQEIAKKRKMVFGTIVGHLEDLLEKKKLSLKDIEHLRPNKRDFDLIAGAFKKSFKTHGDYRLTPVKSALGSKYTFEELRLARIFLV